MKIVVDSKVLKKSLSLLGPVISKKNHFKPILADVLLEAGGGKITATTTDLEVGIRVNLDAEIVEEGNIACPYIGLLGPASAAKGLITIRTPDDEAVGSRVLLDVAGGGEVEILADDPADYPEVPQAEGSSVVVPGAEILKGIRLTSFAMARERKRYALNGLLLSVEKGKKICLTATDMKRIARYELNPTSSILKRNLLDDGKKPIEREVVPFEAILPIQAIKALRGMVDGKGEVRIFPDLENVVVFQTPKGEVATRTIEGQFPPCQTVFDGIDKGYICVNLPIAALGDALDAVSVAVNRDSPAVRFKLSRKGINLDAEDSEGMKAVALIPGGTYKGSPMEIGFNPHFLEDFLAAVKKELDETTIPFMVKEPTLPASVRMDDGRYKYVVMPVFFKGE